MAFIPAANTGRFTLVYNDIGNLAENVFHVLFDSEPSASDLEDVCSIIASWWDVSVQPLVCAGVEFSKIMARDMTVDSGVGIEFTTGLPLTGTGTSCLTSSITVAVKWGTGLAGRSFRGRTYHVGIPADGLAASPNQISTTYADDLDEAYTALIDLIADFGAQLVVASFFHDNAPRVEAVLTPITTVSVNRDVDSQRRRLNGRGA